jgi:hypothetical protein
MDGSLDGNKECRTKMFETSGKRALYPQVFTHQGAGELTFIGDMEMVQDLVESDDIPDEILAANPTINTFKKIFGAVAGERNSGGSIGFVTGAEILSGNMASTDANDGVNVADMVENGLQTRKVTKRESLVQGLAVVKKERQKARWEANAKKAEDDKKEAEVKKAADEKKKAKERAAKEKRWRENAEKRDAEEKAARAGGGDTKKAEEQAAKEKRWRENAEKRDAEEKAAKAAEAAKKGGPTKWDVKAKNEQLKAQNDSTESQAAQAKKLADKVASQGDVPTGFIEPGAYFFSLEEILRRKTAALAGDVTLEGSSLESYLDEDDFADAFGMSKEAYKTAAGWKKTGLRKKLGLF